MKNIIRYAFPIALVLAVASCKGTEIKATGASNTPPAPKAVVTLRSTVPGALPANTIITSYDVYLTLPAGVTVKSSDLLNTDPGVVVATGEGSVQGTTVGAVTIPGTPNRVRLMVINPAGMNSGEFSTVYCDYDRSNPPAHSDFSVSYVVGGFNTDPGAINQNVDLSTAVAVGTAVVLQ